MRGIPDSPQDLCDIYTWFHGFGGVICILPPVTAIFTIRVGALYRDSEYSRTVVCIVWALWALETAGEIITTVRVEIGQHSDSSIINGPGCLTVPGKDMKLYQSELLAWVPALVGSFILFMLTMYKLVHLFKDFFTADSKKPGYKLICVRLSFLRDGTLYFFLVFGATLLTLVSDVSSHLGFFNDWWHPYFLLIYSISGSRLVLNIRKSAQVEEPYLHPSLEPLNRWDDSEMPILEEHVIARSDIEAGLK